VNEIEKKLSKLESTAARIISDLHCTVERGRSTHIIIRRDLEQLRKFLFVMHYRSNEVVKTYFSPDHPEQSFIGEKMKRFNKNLGMESPADTWLYFLRYYLDKSLYQIELDAIKGAPPNISVDDIDGYFMKESLKVPDYAPAITYAGHAADYYLGIVQAASGDEFVLGHNTFGLWEGLMDVIPGLHRLFIVSPKVALILRSNTFRLDSARIWIKTHRNIMSNLIDIPLESPVSEPLPRPWNQTTPYADFIKMKAEARETKFTFKITKLTREQTYDVNRVILVNARKSVTFLNPNSMRLTIRRLWLDTNVVWQRYRYEDLIRRLTSNSSAMNGEVRSGRTDPVITLPAPPSTSLATGTGSRPCRRTKGKKGPAYSPISETPANSVASTKSPSSIPEISADRGAQIDTQLSSLPTVLSQLGSVTNPSSSGERASRTNIHSIDPVLVGPQREASSHPLETILQSLVRSFTQAMYMRQRNMLRAIEAVIDEVIGFHLYPYDIDGNYIKIPSTVRYEWLYFLWKISASLVANHDLGMHPLIFTHEVSYDILVSYFILRIKAPEHSFVPKKNAKLMEALDETAAKALLGFLQICTKKTNLANMEPPKSVFKFSGKKSHAYAKHVFQLGNLSAMLGVIAEMAKRRHDVLDSIVGNMKIYY